MEYSHEIRLLENARILLSIVDDVQKCLDEVSRNLKKIIPDSGTESRRKYAHFQITNLFRNHRQARVLSTIQEETHQNSNQEISINDRPPTPSSSFADETSSLTSTKSDEWIKNPPSDNPNRDQETKKKEKEWIFPSLVMKKRQSQTKDSQNSKCEELPDISLKSPKSETCSKDEATQDSSVSYVKSFYVCQPSRSLPDCDNNWKCRYAINDYDQADSMAETMMNIKENVMIPSQTSNVRSSSTDYDLPSIYLGEKIQKLTKFLTPSESSSFESALPPSTFEQERNSYLKDSVSKFFQQFKAELSQMCQFNNLTIINCTSSQRLKRLDRRKYGILGPSRRFCRQSQSKCRIHRIFCISCGHRFRPNQVDISAESRKNASCGLVKKLVDKWETAIGMKNRK